MTTEDIKNKLYNLAIDWAEYEDESGGVILGYSLYYLILYYAFDDIVFENE